MVRARFRLGMDHDRPRPELFCASPRVRDGRGTVHAERLRGVDVELVRVQHANAVMLPLGFGIHAAYCMLS